MASRPTSSRSITPPRVALTSTVADRAGLLCVQNLDPCVTTFMKLAGGASRLWAEMDQAEFVRQIQDYIARDMDRPVAVKLG